jgi:hypothetical protein
MNSPITPILPPTHLLQHMSLISEKILPERIKSITWNKRIDIIVVNCGSYFEVHRIGFKHEEIFKKEEKCEIKEIVFLDVYQGNVYNSFNENQNQSNKLNLNSFGINDIYIAVILEDSTIQFVNLSTCEITHQTKLSKGENYSSNAGDFSAGCFLNKNYLHNLTTDQNPFIHEINFNSFSKIEVAGLNFLQNNFDFSHCYIYNSKKNEINFYLKFLINFGTMKLDKKYDLVKSLKMKNENITENSINLDHFNKSNFFENFILLGKLENKNDLNLHTINLNNFSQFTDKSFFHMYFSTQIIEYISNILNIFTKIINKLGIIFFDKYIFANKLEHDLNEHNEEIFINTLNRELKRLLYMGTMSESLKNLLKKDLYEAKSIIKMDENIYFNLKNIEDIFVENIKPNLNSLCYYINEIKFYLEGEENFSIIKEIEDYFHIVYVKFENFLTKISTLKNNYRNFLAWLNNFNIQPNNTETTKNQLNSHVINYEGLYSFIDESCYNMKSVLDLIEKDQVGDDQMIIEVEKEETDLQMNKNVENFETKSFVMKNELVMNYLRENNLDHLFTDEESISNTTNFKEEKNYNNSNHSNLNQKSIKSILTKIKEKLNLLRTEISNKISERERIKIDEFIIIKNIPQNNESLENSQNLLNIKNSKLIWGPEKSILLIPLENFLLILGLNNTNSFSVLKLNLSYDNIIILDFNLHKQNELLLLVKSIINETDEQGDNTQNIKYSLIVSELENYNFTNINQPIIDLSNIQSVPEMIKIDKLIDIDCSDSSFISSGERGLICIVDNKKNKISIVDLLSSNIN